MSGFVVLPKSLFCLKVLDVDINDVEQGAFGIIHNNSRNR
jgi:hypothetical protein